MHTQEHKKKFLNAMKKLALSHGGDLISNDWSGSRKNYQFTDQFGNIFSLSYSALIRGSWNGSLIAEPICNQIFEHLFQKKFIKTRQIIKKEFTGLNHNLELDGYCEELNIAFEYQGHPSHWDKNHLLYKDTIKRDLTKQQFCEKNNISLFVIPPFNSKNYDNFFNHVLEHIQIISFNKKIQLPSLNLSSFKINFSNINYGKPMLKGLEIIALNNGGKLLSTEWKGNYHRYLFEDKNGIQFEIGADKLQKRGWPQDIDNFLKNQLRIYKNDNKLLEELEIIALTNEGKLLSKEWKGSESKYLFEDKNGIQFEINHHQLKQRGWPQDIQEFIKNQSNKQKSSDVLLKELEIIALNNGGKLLSKEWKGSRNKYLFETKDGVQFSYFAYLLKSKGWPLKNSKNEIFLKRLEIIALTNGGKLLSKEWKGSESKYLFETKDGVQFEIRSDKLKEKGWPKDIHTFLKNQSRKIK